MISSEIQPLETRCLGQGLTVFVSLLNGAIIGQSFLTMLCKLQYGVYLLFAAMQLLAIVFCFLLLPETTGAATSPAANWHIQENVSFAMHHSFPLLTKYTHQRMFPEQRELALSA